MSLFGFLLGGEDPQASKKTKPCIYCGKPIPMEDADGMCELCADMADKDDQDGNL